MKVVQEYIKSKAMKAIKQGIKTQRQSQNVGCVKIGNYKI